MNSRKSLTLIELILAIVLVTLVVMSVGISHSYFTKIIVSSIHQAILYQRTSFALELMKREMMTGKYISISDTAGARNLFIGKIDPGTGTEYQSVYYLDKASEQLRYKANTTQAAYKTILPHVKTFTPFGVEPLDPPANTIFRGARITLEAEEPLKRTDKFSYLQSLAFCRIPKSKDFVWNKTQNKYYSKIQPAIGEASTTSIDEIRCMGNNPGTFDGIFRENITINQSLTLKGGYDKTFTTQNTQTTPTTIDGQQKGSVISCTGSSLTVDINGFQIQNGTSSNGGGIYANCSSNSNIAIYNNTIQSNTATSYGGGIYVNASGSTFIIANNNISGNKVSYNMAANVGGGGIYTTSGNTSTITITNNVVQNNETRAWSLFAGAGGAGIYANNTTNSKTTISSNYVANNQALAAVVGSTTYDGAGGGIYVNDHDGGSSITITRNTIIGVNHANRGAGIYVLSGLYPPSSTIDIKNNYIAYNTLAGFLQTFYGAGIYIVGGTVNLKNNLIVGNTRAWQYQVNIYGGGIYVTSGTFNSINDTIAYNIPDSGTYTYYGGIYGAFSSATINLRNSICYFNYPPALAGGSPNIVYSDIQGYTGSGDPKFVAGSYALGTGSPCIDAGDTALSDIIPPGLGGTRSDMGVYGGPDAISPMVPAGQTGTGPLIDLPAPPNIREDICGTY